MFQRARLKLTAWYLAIIMVVSLLFSGAIYTSITAEYHRFEKMEVRVQEELQQAQGSLFTSQVELARVSRLTTM